MSASLHSIHSLTFAFALASVGGLAAFTSTAALGQDAPPSAPPATPSPPAPPAAPAAPNAGAPAAAPVPRGLKLREPEALPGYTLIAPLTGKTIHLVDLEGNDVHRWVSEFEPGCEYFLDNGHLLRCCRVPATKPFGGTGGEAGRLEEFAWDGTLVWSFNWANEEHMQHHDIEHTPSGTILFLSYEYKSRSDAIAAGRHPAYVGKDGIWSEVVVEVEPILPEGGEVIWEWHAWDHLIQDIDADAANYGDVAAHPELLDLNADLRKAPPTDAETEQLHALGYIADTPAAGGPRLDWLHLNAIDYNAALDQIVMSSPHIDEIFLIDHCTTSDEAASHAGGAHGHGGDLLYRWGNPKNYGAGGPADQRLFGQHDVRWIPAGLPGAGHLTVFNNGAGRPDGDHSEIWELAPPLQADGSYDFAPFAAPKPDQPLWRYVAPDPKEFFSGFISSAHRLINGNTLICEGASGRVLEVTNGGKRVWEYLNPFAEPPAAGSTAPGVPPYAMFRATRIPADHPGLAGKSLTPLPK